MAITLPELPYALDALEPHLSSETLQYHYHKHHQTYVTKLNQQLEGHSLAEANLAQIVQSSEGGMFNNAAQVWNHNFYWQCLAPNAGGAPHGAIAEAINRDFGDFQTFQAQFTQTALTTFGSGWAWLIKDDEKLRITSSSNADTPLAHQQQAVLTCDVWEHAYYIDYRNARPEYLKAFWHLINWDFVNAQLAA